MTKQQLIDEYARVHLCATCEWKNGDICTLPRCMKLEERSKNGRFSIRNIPCPALHYV